MPKKTKKAGRETSRNIDKKPELVSFLKKEGYVLVRSTGRHLIYRHSKYKEFLIPIPKGNRILPYLVNKVAKQVEEIGKRRMADGAANR